MSHDGSVNLLNRQPSRFMKQSSKISRTGSSDSDSSTSTKKSTKNMLPISRRSNKVLKPNHKSTSFLMPEIDDDDDEELIKPFPVPFELQLFDEELALSDQVFWFSQVLGSSDLLRYVPTSCMNLLFFAYLYANHTTMLTTAD
jgi:hypothetical protein